jgi:hypothetical protein
MENEFGEVNLIKEIKLRSWLKASFYDMDVDDYDSVRVFNQQTICLIMSY